MARRSIRPSNASATARRTGGPSGCTRYATDPGSRIGAAIHSVRAVPRADLATVVAVAADRPLHVHLSEQPAENEACLERYGCTPTQLLADAGALGSTTTAVHATHLTPDDVTLLGSARATACICPTTERDLADGIGPAPALRDAGAALSLGSDQHAVDRPVRGRARPRTRRAARVAAPRDLRPRRPRCRDDRARRRSAGPTPGGSNPVRAPTSSRSASTPSAPPAPTLRRSCSPRRAADVDTVVVDGRTVVSGGVHVLGRRRPACCRRDRSTRS